jgi:hypothetical protein
LINTPRIPETLTKTFKKKAEKTFQRSDQVSEYLVTSVELTMHSRILSTSLVDGKKLGRGPYA